MDEGITSYSTRGNPKDAKCATRSFKAPIRFALQEPSNQNTSSSLIDLTRPLSYILVRASIELE